MPIYSWSCRIKERFKRATFKRLPDRIGLILQNFRPRSSSSVNRKWGQLPRPPLHGYCRLFEAGIAWPQETRMLEKIGPYQICRKIRAGGVGVVYQGWDERLRRAVAVKTLHQSSADPEALCRLWREVRYLRPVDRARS